MLTKGWAWRLALLLLLWLLAGGVVGYVIQQSPPPGKSVTLYFASRDGLYLVPEYRLLPAGFEKSLQEEKIVAMAQFILQELNRGPRTKWLTKTLPEGTRVRRVFLEERILVVDFSRELKENHQGGSTGELMTVYSIVNSLGALEGVEAVQILVEGMKEKTLAGHLDLRQPLLPDWSLVKR